MASAQDMPAMVKLRAQCLKRGAAGIKGLGRYRATTDIISTFS